MLYQLSFEETKMRHIFIVKIKTILFDFYYFKNSVTIGTAIPVCDL